MCINQLAGVFLLVMLMVLWFLAIMCISLECVGVRDAGSICNGTWLMFFLLYARMLIHWTGNYTTSYVELIIIINLACP